MNPNALFLAGTDLLSEVLWSAGMRRLWRPPLDLRLVYYHGVGPGRAPCFRYLSDEVPRDDFAYHLDYLMNNYRMLSLRDAVDEMVKGKHSPKPICSISFDDGLSSVYTEALPLLRERNLPATVFLDTASVGNGYMTWLHLTSYLLSEFGVRRLAELFNKLKSDQLPAAPILKPRSWLGTRPTTKPTLKAICLETRWRSLNWTWLKLRRNRAST